MKFSWNNGGKPIAKSWEAKTRDRSHGTLEPRQGQKARKLQAKAERQRIKKDVTKAPQLNGAAPAAIQPR